MWRQWLFALACIITVGSVGGHAEVVRADRITLSRDQGCDQEAKGNFVLLCGFEYVGIRSAPPDQTDSLSCDDLFGIASGNTGGSDIKSSGRPDNRVIHFKSSIGLRNVEVVWR